MQLSIPLGNAFLVIDKLHICVSGETMEFPASLSSRAVRPSRPHDLDGVRSFRWLNTVSGVVSVNVNVGGLAG